jgi:hypothetical protein
VPTLAKNRIQPKAIAAIIALLVGGTYILDRIAMFFARPYLLAYYNARFVKKTVPFTIFELTWFTTIITGYFLVVYHLLVLIAIALVFFKHKFKPYKRELLLAYVIIAVTDMAWVGVNRLWIDRF